MAQLGISINPQDHSTDQNDFELLPNMNARLEVVASETRNEGNNLSLNLTIEVIEPEEFKGRRIWQWIDYQHSDPERQGRGQRDLSKLCRAMQHEGALEDSEQLHFVSFAAQIEQRPAGVAKSTGNPYKASNKIKRYWYPDENNTPEIGVISQQPAAAAQRPANDNRPAAANTNKPAQPAKAAGARPWSK